MRFFFDRCVPIRIARMVAAYESSHTVRHLDEDTRFASNTSDVEWLGTLAKDDPTWVVISGDAKILRDRVERSALDKSGLKFFCLDKGWGAMDFHERAWKIIRIWPEIVDSALHRKERIYRVSAGRALKVEPVA